MPRLPGSTGDVMLSDPHLTFVPSRVEGLHNVTGITIYSDRLELISTGSTVTLPFAEMAVWPGPAFLYRRLYRWGWRPGWWWRRRKLYVGERDWFHPPSERFFRFYTKPPLVVFMPDEPIDTNYDETLFYRVQEVIRHGGFETYDLG